MLKLSIPRLRICQGSILVAPFNNIAAGSNSVNAMDIYFQLVALRRHIHAAAVQAVAHPHPGTTKIITSDELTKRMVGLIPSVATILVSQFQLVLRIHTTI